jgi:hypothetical protein
MSTDEVPAKVRERWLAQLSDGNGAYDGRPFRVVMTDSEGLTGIALECIAPQHPGIADMNILRDGCGMYDCCPTALFLEVHNEEAAAFLCALLNADRRSQLRGTAAVPGAVADRYLCTATAPVTVHWGARVEPGAVGVSGPIGKRDLFGLVQHNDPGRLSFMSYGLDYFVPADALERCVDGWFHFRVDSGRYGDVKVSVEDLRRALGQLGLLR